MAATRGLPYGYPFGVRHAVRIAAVLGAAHIMAACEDPIPYCSLDGLRLDRLPEHGATDVPANARIWLNIPAFSADDAGLAAIEIIGPGGPVEVARTIIDTRWLAPEPEAFTVLDLWVFTPTAPLSPGLHEVRIPGNGDWTFTVAAAIDDEAPDVPVVENVEYSAYEDEGRALVTLQAAYEILILEQEGRASLDPATLSGQAVDAWSGDFVMIGDEDCLANWEAGPGARTRIRLSAFDVAGNHSGFGEWIDIDIPGEGCNCHSGSSGALSLFLTTLVILRRPRRRHASSTTRDVHRGAPDLTRGPVASPAARRP